MGRASVEVGAQIGGMVAKIASGKSIRGILLYNENKVSLGEAQLIMASGFAGEIDDMDFREKLGHFTRLTELNGKVKINAMHISLNFHPDDELNDAKLQQICAAYLERIGFSEQPFLVYLHDDSAHPHVHIATTNIQRDGERMDINKIGFRSRQGRIWRSSLT